MQARAYLRTLLKPGVKLIDVCELLEARVRELVAAEFPLRGTAFPTGCSLNHVAAHWTPNPGDTTELSYDDVVKFDFGVHVNGER